MIEETCFTRLTIEQPDLKVTWEVPYTDVGADDMISAFKAILVGMTFHQETAQDIVQETIDDFKEEQQ